jgi:nitrogen fixation protein NifQ
MKETVYRKKGVERRRARKLHYRFKPSKEKAMSDLDILSREIEDYLKVYAINDEARYVIAPLIAKKSLEMNHLYQDLGFKSRVQMGAYMAHHFPNLAALKPKDKLWKKFLYDAIGKVAPACATCNDQEHCFSCLIAEASA